MKKTSLGNLSARLAQKPTAAELTLTSSAQIEGAGEAHGKQKRGSQPDGRKGVILRLKPEAWLQLKSLAAEQTLQRGEIFTMQSALEEALNDLFRRYNKPPIA